MPEAIIKKFQKEYGAKKGKQVFYATANKQGRDSETFKKKKTAQPRKPGKKERS